jgi:hypothetical protein
MIISFIITEPEWYAEDARARMLFQASLTPDDELLDWARENMVEEATKDQIQEEMGNRIMAFINSLSTENVVPIRVENKIVWITGGDPRKLPPEYTHFEDFIELPIKIIQAGRIEL